MRTGGRRLALPAACGLAGVSLALAGIGGPARGGQPSEQAPPSLSALIAHRPVAVETVYFTGRRGAAAVRVVRGGVKPIPPPPRSLPPGPPEPPAIARGQHVEIVSFGQGFASEVRVVRGVSAGAGDGAARHIERVSFGDPRLPAVTIVRGLVGRPELLSPNLFGPADGGELDRIAFAVDGVESRHGADLRMWRPELNGPQGPMQVSAAAATDVGGGDRFDMTQNRLLGRAYLAQMFQRYGNWPDAVAAYNWGPGSMDQWIAGGRDPLRLPPGVAWYVSRVLRDALITTAARTW